MKATHGSTNLDNNISRLSFHMGHFNSVSLMAFLAIEFIWRKVLRMAHSVANGDIHFLITLYPVYYNISWLLFFRVAPSY